jgi:hypothetical protein
MPKKNGTKSPPSIKTIVVSALKGGKSSGKPKATSASGQKAKAPRTPSLLTPQRRSR